MESNLVLKAATFAAEAHTNQRRRYHEQPYINHLIRVGFTASTAGLPAEAVAAGLLHDVLEDTEKDEQILRANFTPRVVELVKLLTKWWPDEAEGEEIALQKEKYYRAILGDHDATCLKLLDRADNLSDFVNSLPDSLEEAQKYLLETSKEFPSLVNECDNPDVKSTFNKAVQWLEKSLRK